MPAKGQFRNVGPQFNHLYSNTLVEMTDLMKRFHKISQEKGYTLMFASFYGRASLPLQMLAQLLFHFIVH